MERTSGPSGVPPRTRTGAAVAWLCPRSGQGLRPGTLPASLPGIRLHPARARAEPSEEPLMGWLAVPKDWIASAGEIVKFCGGIVGEVFTLKVFRFFGETLRQAGILILSS